MSSVDPSGISRPLRVAGIALLGGAALAAVIGVATLSTGGSTPGAEGGAAATSSLAPPPVTSVRSSTTAPSSPATSSSSAQPTPTSASTTPTQQPTAPNTPPVTGPAQGVAPQPGNAQAAARPDVRVYNNSTVKGLAARAADDFRAAGWNVPEVGNYPGGVLATTTVYFRPGTPEEAAAHELAASIQARVEPRFAGIQDASPGVIVIVTNDYKGYQSK